MQYPNLATATVYRLVDVESYIAIQNDTNDWNCALLKLNTHRRGKSNPSVWRPGAEMVVEYQLLPLGRFATHLAATQNNPLSADDMQRIATIRELLIGGAVILPLWIDFRFLGGEPIHIAEGNHRLRVFAELGVDPVPVFVCRHDLTA